MCIQSIPKFMMRMFFAVSFLIGFGASAFAADGRERFAAVDVGKIFDEYEKTKNFDQEFQTEGRLKQEERDALVHEIRRLRDEQLLLSEEARKGKQGAVDAKIKELDGFDEEVRKSLGEKRDKAVKEVFQDIENVMTQYGERKGYDFVFNERALLYKNKRFDVTADIIRELNERFKKAK